MATDLTTAVGVTLSIATGIAILFGWFVIAFVTLAMLIVLAAAWHEHLRVDGLNSKQ